MTIERCPICGFKKWKYVSYAEECYGTVEQHGYCARCGYTVEQAYSQPIVGFELNQTRGCKYNGKWHGKNTRKRKRMKRKYDIKHTNKDWMLFFI